MVTLIVMHCSTKKTTRKGWLFHKNGHNEVLRPLKLNLGGRYKSYLGNTIIPL